MTVGLATNRSRPADDRHRSPPVAASCSAARAGTSATAAGRPRPLACRPGPTGRYRGDLMVPTRCARLLRDHQQMWISYQNIRGTL